MEKCLLEECQNQFPAKKGKRFCSRKCKRLHLYRRNKQSFLDRRATYRKTEKGKKAERQLLKNSFKLRTKIAINKVMSKCFRSTARFPESKYFEHLGYYPLEIIQHFAQRMKPGMTFENYGKAWQIDHAKPIASFQYESFDDPQFKEAWALSNLQPLTPRENCKKGSKH